jgi:hypothetical protein
LRYRYTVILPSNVQQLYGYRFTAKTPKIKMSKSKMSNENVEKQNVEEQIVEIQKVEKQISNLKKVERKNVDHIKCRKFQDVVDK